MGAGERLPAVVCTMQKVWIFTYKKSEAGIKVLRSARFHHIKVPRPINSFVLFIINMQSDKTRIDYTLKWTAPYHRTKYPPMPISVEEHVSISAL